MVDRDLDLPERLPERLRERIAADLAPVRPLAPPSRRALLLVPWTLLALATFWLHYGGVRRDATELGPLLAWGLSIGQVALALAVGITAMREAVPGAVLPRSVVAAGALGALGFHLAGLYLVFARVATPVPAERWGQIHRHCLHMELLIALPALVVAVWLVLRGLAIHPALAGALGGLAAGLLADSTYRLFCRYSEPAHVLGAHTAAILAMTLLGAAAGKLVAGLARRRR